MAGLDTCLTARQSAGQCQVMALHNCFRGNLDKVTSGLLLATRVRKNIMQMRKGLLGVEIANKIIRYVYLEKQGNRYVLLKADALRLYAEMPAPGSLFKAVEEILTREGIVPQRIFLTLAHTDTLIHHVLLPKIAARDLREVVAGEIEKLPSFSSRDFDFIYRKSAASKEKDKVLFAAVGRDILDFICQEVSQIKIFCRDVEIVPLNLNRITPAMQAAAEPFAFLIVHEQFSQLAIFKNGECEHIYKSSIGLDRFPSKIKLSTEGIVINWASEFNRVLKSYILKNETDSIKKICIIWDQTKAPELAGFLTEHLEILVEPLTAQDLGKIKIEPGDFNSIYALALTPVLHYIHHIKPKFPLDYFLRRFQLKEYLYQTAMASVIFLAVLVSGLGFFGSVFEQEAAKLQKQKERLTRQIMSLEKESQSLFREQQEYLETRRRLLAQATFVNSLNRVSWSQVFSAVSRELPDHLALTSFQFSDSRKAQIHGEAFDMEVIAEMIRRIEESKILKEGKFDFLSEREIKNQKIYDFGILANLKETKSD